jgi:hypothetical protein
MLWCPAGRYASNEAIVELIQACLRVCFEKVLSELLRKCAEHALADMIQILFSRVEDMVDGGEMSVPVSTLVIKQEDTLSHRGQTLEGEIFCAPGSNMLSTFLFSTTIFIFIHLLFLRVNLNRYCCG